MHVSMCQLLDSVAPTLERVGFLIDDHYTSHGSGRSEMVTMATVHGGRGVGIVEFVQCSPRLCLGLDH